jgi:hypothetical protein
MSDDAKPRGYASLAEAMAAIAAHERAKQRETRSSREKLSLPKSEAQRSPPVR